MLRLGNLEFKSHLLLGTGKFSSNEVMRSAVEASGANIVTVALKRVEIKGEDQNLLPSLNIPGVTLLPNTSGVRTAKEAIFAAEAAREALGTEMIKLEIHPDPRYLLPDGEETLEAARELVKLGFVVLPYVSADPVLCRKLEDLGCAAVMPLGSPIGSNQGLLTRDFIRIIIEQSSVPVIVDAGLGAPSHACEAMEMGAGGVMVNTAIAVAGDAVKMATAFRDAVECGRSAHDAGLPSGGIHAEATSPLTKFLDTL